MMVIERLSRVLSVSCEDMYDIAADVERYPEFLNWWVSARITKREPDKLWVEQELGVGPIRIHFASQAALRPPERIEVTSADAMFREFRLMIMIARARQAGCTMRVQATLTPRSIILQQIVNRVLAPSMDDLIVAFETRAHRLHPGSVSCT